MELSPNAKIFCANLLCSTLLLFYTIIGGFIFLHLEQPHSIQAKQAHAQRKLECIMDTLKDQDTSYGYFEQATAEVIAQKCLIDMEYDSRKEWNLRNSLLFGFGILTTLGYGKIEPMTMNARVFTVVWGLLGVPFTVILLTNLGLYMRSAEGYFRKNLWKRRHNNATPPNNNSNNNYQIQQEVEVKYKRDQMSPFMLASVVLLYLTVGAVFLPLLNGQFEFINGLYYSYLCFTAIEYGALIPHNNSYIPIVIVYMCVGLAMSTIALDIGSKYVRKLYYYGRRVTNMANVRIWFGGRSLKVNELIVALGQTIGVNPDCFDELNIDEMVNDAMQVKEGHLKCVPQGYRFMEGIWPPELVPLFLRDGKFPEYVDAEIKKYSGSIYSNSNAVESEPSVSLSTFHDGRLHRCLGSAAPATCVRWQDQNNNDNKVVI